MNFEALLFSLTLALEKEKIPYLVTGALAVSYFGRLRATHDFDFIVEVKKGDLERLKRFLQQLGGQYVIDFAQVEESVKFQSHFNIFYLPTALKIDFWLLKDEPFDRSRFQRRKKVKIGRSNLYLSSPEDLILIKLKWCKDSKSEKHFSDAASILQIQKGKLETSYLLRWAKKLALTHDLKKLEKLEIQQW